MNTGVSTVSEGNNLGFSSQFTYFCDPRYYATVPLNTKYDLHVMSGFICHSRLDLSEKFYPGFSQEKISNDLMDALEFLRD